MTKKIPTTEDLLKTGKRLTLSISEHADIKASLLAYAQYHQPQPQPPHRRTGFFAHWQSLAAIPALALFLSIGTGYAATSSLPGESLYAIKVNVVEEMIGLTYTSTINQIEYRHELFERRLDEAHTLALRDELTDDTARILTSEMTKLNETLTTLIEQTSPLEATRILTIVSDVVSMTTAVESLAGPTVSEATAQALTDTVDTAEALHADEVRDFIAEQSTSTITNYIEAQLDEISDELQASSTTTRSTTTLIELMTDTKDAVAEEDLSAALTLTTEALQTLEALDYTFDHIHEISEDD